MEATRDDFTDVRAVAGRRRPLGRLFGRGKKSCAPGGSQRSLQLDGGRPGAGIHAPAAQARRALPSRHWEDWAATVSENSRITAKSLARTRRPPAKTYHRP